MYSQKKMEKKYYNSNFSCIPEWRWSRLVSATRCLKRHYAFCSSHCTILDRVHSIETKSHTRCRCWHVARRRCSSVYNYGLKFRQILTSRLYHKFLENQVAHRIFDIKKSTTNLGCAGALLLITNIVMVIVLLDQLLWTTNQQIQDAIGGNSSY